MKIKLSIKRLVKNFNSLKYYTKIKSVGLLMSLISKNKFTVDGLSIKTPDNFKNLTVLGQLALSKYEAKERYCVKKYLSPNSKVLELGGCMGVVACTINRVLENPTQHVVIEANSQIIPCLKDNANLNNCKFKIKNCIISNEKVHDFYVSQELLSSSTITKTKNKIRVTGASVKDIEQEFDIKFDTLVMDIEGGEYYFIKENKDWISTLSTIIMEVELDNKNVPIYQIEECEFILKNIGFSFVYRKGQMWVLKK